MSNAFFQLSKPLNEEILQYKPNSPEKVALKAKLAELSSKEIEIPIIIGGKEIKTGNIADCRMPHNKEKRIGFYHKASKAEVALAIESSKKAHQEWSRMSFESRIAIFKKAADLLAGPMRQTLNAATMLGQSKNAFQAEIDSACELIDFFRFNGYYAQEIYKEQPSSPAGVWNRMEYRSLEGFIFAVTPFNFTSIAGNLPTAPAIMGNTSLWKPASSSVYSGYFIMKLLEEAGLPPGVINFLPGSGGEVGNPVLASRDLAGVHFTGSTKVFQDMWKNIGNNISNYASYPRIVGETGGKDFVFVHESADIDAVVTALVRGAFEFQGQKCSAASRAYIPDSIWPKVKEKLVFSIEDIKMGDVVDFTNFMNAVIDKSAFDTIKTYIEHAKKSPDAEILIGGKTDDSIGFFIEPTVIVANKPDYKSMVEEIFGPVLTIFVYKANQYEETLSICDKTSSYALTGAVFSQDRLALEVANKALLYAAGNFYINDKPTGAVVGQQPFGGARASGTNDKAGSFLNMVRWTNPRSIKETFVPPTKYQYPFMDEK